MARRDRRRATTGALAASILVHLALFIVLARQAAPEFRAPPEASPDFDLQLVNEPAATPPSPPAPLRTARRAPPAEVRVRPAPRPPLKPARRSVQAPARLPPPRALLIPSAPPARSPADVTAPGAASGGSQGGGAREAAGRWTVQNEGDQDGVRRFLRATVGCSHEDYLRLTGLERAACDRRLGQEARTLGIAPDKLAGFIAAAQAQERTRAGRTGPLEDLVTPCKGEGANLDRSCLNLPRRAPDD